MAELVNSDEEGCAICLSEPSDPITTSCGHTYCRSCLVRALVRFSAPGFGQCPLCRRRLSMYTSRSAAGAPLILPQGPASGDDEAPAQGPFGYSYVQGRTWGLASYHFESPESVYISYIAAPQSWRLEDESPVPERAPFEDHDYVPETRTFTGTIRWSPLRFGGCACGLPSTLT